YMTPFHPRSALVADILRSGRLGALRFAHTAFTFPLRDAGNHRWHAEFGGGALLDVGIYCVAPLLLAAGRTPIDLTSSAVVTAGGVDSSFAGWLDFGGGFTATFECSFEAPERQRAEIVGTGAALVVDRAFTPGPDDTDAVLLHADGSTERLECGGGVSYRGMVDHFSTVVRGGADPRRTAADSIELLTVLDRLRNVAREARR
ncbi:MAG TPA: hypothetical protein VHN98_05130, partial [Acidimicrobiales bacterium]|nr:hypothetical protein [Acidimicrobiales bacterium]